MASTHVERLYQKKSLLDHNKEGRRKKRADYYQER
jgi:hypothetical protein